ncbi:MAG: DMT family transporter, partial [Sporolactobacillus sp.]
IWGSSYLFMKMGLTGMADFQLIAWRFAVAFVLTAILFYKKIRRSNWHTIRDVAVLGGLLFAVFSTLMIGIRTTSATKAGFLVSLTIIFVPLISALVWHQKIGKKNLVSLLIAIVGLYMLTGLGTASGTVTDGDLWCMTSAFFNACYLIAADHLTKKNDSIALGIWQLGFTAALAIVCLLLFEQPQWPEGSHEWAAIFGLGILCSAIGYTMQSVAQKHTTSVHASMIFTLEPVFAALFSGIFSSDFLSGNEWVGASLLLISVILSIRQPKKRKPLSTEKRDMRSVSRV